MFTAQFSERTIIAALLLVGCSSDPTQNPPNEPTDDSTSGTGGAPSSVDVDMDGIPDEIDDFIDLDGNGIDDREENKDVDQDGDGRPDCVPGVRGTTQVPRLKNREYDRTVRDLVGVTGLTESGGALPSTLLATDQSGSISDLAWSSYQTVGKRIAAQVMDDAQAKARFVSCDVTDAECLRSTIVDFGRRAFRRPLSEEDIARFEALAQPQNTETGTSDEVAELLLYGFLVSPSFLMRSEIEENPGTAGNFQLSGPEIASRLSYMLWGSMPDEALSDAADDGLLETKDQILTQAVRMLADDKARDMVADFHRQYLHMGVNTRWDTFVKEPNRFPAFDPELRPALSRETEMFFEQVVFEEGSFQDLFLSTRGFANAPMAQLYGLDATGLGADLEPVDLPDRPGFLTRLGFLNAYSAASRTSPIVRGAFIAKDVMGLIPGAPPPGAESTPLPESPDLLTNRERVSEQTSAPACKKCHFEYINPPGFVLEAFDTMGVPQTNEADTGAPLDTKVSMLVDGELTPLETPAQLMQALANSSDAQVQYAQKLIAYLLQRPENSQDACLVETVSARMTNAEYSILQLIADTTQADSFSVRALDNGVSQ